MLTGYNTPSLPGPHAVFRQQFLDPLSPGPGYLKVVLHRKMSVVVYPNKTASAMNIIETALLRLN